MREVTLPSKAILKVDAAPFSVAKALYQAILKELKGVTLNSSAITAELYRDIFCIGFSSPLIESCLDPCLARCTINYTGNDMKIDKDTFDPVARRDDYMTVCVEVMKENVMPFMKSLYAEYLRISGQLESTPK